jgi:hypothetical protein
LNAPVIPRKGDFVIARGVSSTVPYYPRDIFILARIPHHDYPQFHFGLGMKISGEKGIR